MTTDEHMLSCLAEECCEVGQRVSKILRFGLKDVQKGQSLDNRERLALELDDLEAVIEMCRELRIFRLRDHGAMTAKRGKVLEYLRYSQKVGALKD